MDCSPPASSVHGLLQARILEWVAICFPRGSSQPRHQIQVSCTAGRFFTVWSETNTPLSINYTSIRASLVAQMIKNPPTMQDTWVQSLGWEDPLEEGMATYSHILAWRIPMDREVWWATVFVISESDTTERLSTAHVYFYFHHIVVVFDYCWDGGDFLQYFFTDYTYNLFQDMLLIHRLAFIHPIMWMLYLIKTLTLSGNSFKYIFHGLFHFS